MATAAQCHLDGDADRFAVRRPSERWLPSSLVALWHRSRALSSWFPLAGAVSDLTATEFKGSMAKPYFAPSRYQDLMSVWWRTSPAWASDEHEYCLWLAANHPEVFESEIPVMGYVQVMIEGNARRFSVKGLSISIGSSSGGLQSIPAAPKRAGAEDKWFFELSRKK